MVVWLVFVVGGEKWRFLYTCHVVTAVIGPPCYAPMCFATAKRERERERERGRMNTLALVFLAKEKLESIYFFILLYLYYYALLIELSRLARSFVFKEGLFFCFFGGWVITPI
jgi:hypothetical protein